MVHGSRRVSKCTHLAFPTSAYLLTVLANLTVSNRDSVFVHKKPKPEGSGLQDLGEFPVQLLACKERLSIWLLACLCAL